MKDKLLPREFERLGESECDKLSKCFKYALCMFEEKFQDSSYSSQLPNPVKCLVSLTITPCILAPPTHSILMEG